MIAGVTCAKQVMIATASVAIEQIGGVDVLFDKLGIQPLDSHLRAEDTTEEMWDRILNCQPQDLLLDEQTRAARDSQARRCRRDQDPPASRVCSRSHGTCLCR